MMFRAESMVQVDQLLTAIFLNVFTDDGIYSLSRVSFFIAPVLALHAIQYRQNDLLVVFKWRPVLRAIFYFVCYYLLLLWGVEGGKEFVYFQF
jgi:hypothetical protein